tara:strand:- start:266 stop:901 length:636 start_codon:yes stop_codon:yes gene_type:complete
MILFLDTVSPLAKFSIIEENNVIQSINILNKKDNKISDCIIPAFLKLEKKFQIKNKINKLIICTGPGSYTALRVGISFLNGLSFSMNIPIIGISCPDILSHAIKNSEITKTLIFITSSNDQYFFCTFNKNKNICIKKIDFKKKYELIRGNKYNQTISNFKMPNEIIKIIDMRNHKILSLEKILCKNYKIINKFKPVKIIRPIYISDNKILN